MGCSRSYWRSNSRSQHSYFQTDIKSLWALTNVNSAEIPKEEQTNFTRTPWSWMAKNLQEGLEFTGNRLQVKGNLCLGTCLRLHQSESNRANPGTFSLIRMFISDISSGCHRVCHWNIPLFISALLLCCCYIYLCCCQSFRCQFAQSRTDTNCRAIISLKNSFSNCALL